MVSIAIPASLIDSRSCASLQQATFALYQISRACALFGADEIVVFDVRDEPADKPLAPAAAPRKVRLDETPDIAPPAPVDRPHALIFAANMLQYLVTPAHLRRLIFKPIGGLDAFRYARKLPRVPGLPDSRRVVQGIAVPRERKRRQPGQKRLSKKDKRDARETPYVNVGFDRVLKLRDQTVPVNSQVFVDVAKAATTEPPAAGSGYRVRAVTSFSQIFTESALPDGYAQTLYVPCEHFKSHSSLPLIQEVRADAAPQQGLLLLFGHWKHIQSAVKADAELEIDDASALFDGMLPGLERARVEDGVTAMLGRL